MHLRLSGSDVGCDAQKKYARAEVLATGRVEPSDASANDDHSSAECSLRLQIVVYHSQEIGRRYALHSVPSSAGVTEKDPRGSRRALALAEETRARRKEGTRLA
jgi:hypothetical protein